MTTEMFGAPFGIQQAEAGINANVLAGLRAQQMLGEISQQPADLALKQAQVRMTEAHGREYDAQAAQKAQALQDQQRLMNARVRAQAMTERETEAQNKAIAEAAQKGLLLTVAERPAEGFSAGPAAKVNSYIDKLLASGLDETDVLPLRVKSAALDKDDAAAGHSRATTASELIKQDKLQRERVGQIAGAAASSPAMFTSLIADPEASKLIPQEILRLPFQFAQPHLLRLAQQSIEAAKQTDLKLTALRDASTEKLQRSSESANNARFGVLTQRKEILKNELAVAKKSGGKYSPEYAERQKQAAANEKSLMEARDNKAFPKAPLDPAAREPDKVYTNAKGQRATWRIVGDQGGWEPYTPIRRSPGVSESGPDLTGELE